MKINNLENLRTVLSTSCKLLHFFKRVVQNKYYNCMVLLRRVGRREAQWFTQDCGRLLSQDSSHVSSIKKVSLSFLFPVLTTQISAKANHILEPLRCTTQSNL